MNRLKKRNQEARSVVALSLVKNMGPVAFRVLIEAFGGPEKVLSVPKARFQKIKEARKISWQELTDPALLGRADEEMEKAAKAGADIITIFDGRYPAELKEIYDPPILFYCKGRLTPNNLPKVAVVGSREASFYGLKMAKSISAGLASAGVVVVSGLARGIDSAAHEGALSAGGMTLAVLGGGLNRLYPRENRRTADKIAASGALISEYPMDMAPKPAYFPIRNRIISGLSRAVVIVEAREKSGALITADSALEQGRDVYAVPGNADSEGSRGVNRLLKQGAQWATSASDVLEDLGFESGLPDVETNVPAGLSREEKKVLSYLSSDPVQTDELIESSGLGAGRVVSTLSCLEIKGLVKQLPGKNFVRND